MSRKIQVQSPLQRIVKIIDFYYKRGCNKESVNRVYKEILKQKYEGRKN